MDILAKHLESNNVFEKLRQGSDESVINVCNSTISFISNGSLHGSQPTISVDEILMIFLEYITLSTSYYGLRSVLLCIESIAKINKKYEDCILQTGLVGAIVDLLNIQDNKFKKNTISNENGNENGLIVIRILSYFTDNDKRSCLIFRLHHGIHYLITFVEANNNQNNNMIELALNICHNCVYHSEHTSTQMFESNGLEMCLQYMSNYKPSPTPTYKAGIISITYCINLISSICKLNLKISETFIQNNGFEIIVDYLCKLPIPHTHETKSNIMKLLQLISTMCMNSICAKTIASNNILSILYPFLFLQSQNEEIKCVSSQILTNILRYGMKDAVYAQCTKLYKFNETYTKINIRNKNNIYITADEMELIDFPELEALKKRKEARQEPLKQSECVTKGIIPFVTQPPLHSWSQVLPSDFNKVKEKIYKQSKKRKNKSSVTFNKSTKSLKRRKSASFVLQNKRRASSLIIKNSVKNTGVTKNSVNSHILPKPRAPSLPVISTALFNTNGHKNNPKNKANNISSEEDKNYVTLKWIKNYYTKTTYSYLDTASLRGEPLSIQPCNLIIKLLYQEILTKSKTNHTFIPKIIYDRNELLLHTKTKTQTNNDCDKPPTLEFESRFECGNLHRVIQTGAVEYDLLVSSDYNANKHRQWFYFRIKNMIQNIDYKFNIVNYDKTDSIFNRGCKPTLYSTKRFKESGVEWTRADTNETYYYSNSFNNDYEPQFTDIEPQNINSPKTHSSQTMAINQNDSAQISDHDMNDEDDKKTTIKYVKSASLNSCDSIYINNCKPKRKRALHNNCYSENTSHTASPQPIKNKKITSMHSSSSPSTQPIKKLNYKQIRKRRARLRNKEKQKEKEKQQNDIESHSNFTNVLRRDNAISFDILLSTKRLIGGRKKRKHSIPIPSINNYIINKKEIKYHYTLTFCVRFPYSNDTCFLSYFYPFSYTDFQSYLNVLCISPISNLLNIFRRQLLCFSRLGNRIDLLTITNFNSTMNIMRDRPIIILSARVHSGEVNSSFIMKGIIDFLLSKNVMAKALRNKFVFKIIPLLNPDGVICGNHRCSLSGVDLNRQYQNPSHIYHPPIFHLKKLVQQISESQPERKIFLMCDFHGHSRMMNVTLYGCAPGASYKNGKNNKKFKSKKSKLKSLKLASMDYFLPNCVTETAERYKLFAFLLWQRAANMFNYDQCVWNVSKQKEGTARVVFWREFNIQNTFTMESSYCGSNLNSNLKGFHFNISHYLKMGAKFCAALYDISSSNISNDSKTKIQNAIKQLKSMQKSK